MKINTSVLIIIMLLLSALNVFADDVSIDKDGNISTNVQREANLEVTGASSEIAVVGFASGTGGIGVLGGNDTYGNWGGLGGFYNTFDVGVFGLSNSGYAGYFQGNTWITGNLTVEGTISGPNIGDITSVDAGAGLIGGGSSGQVSLDANIAYLQKRISSSCTAGSSIRAVNQDGTVECEPVTDPGSDITAVYTETGISGGGVSGDLTLEADTTYLQRRVSVACSEGSSIRAINQDGTVTCDLHSNNNMVRTVTYSVYPADGTYYVQNGITGEIDFTGTNGHDAIQYAIDNLPLGGGEIRLSEGLFEIDSTITITTDNVILSGLGKATHVKGIGTPGSIMDGINIRGDHVTIRDFFLDGSFNVVKYGIVFNDNRWSRIEDMTVCCSGTDGIVFGNAKDGVAVNNFLYNHFVNYGGDGSSSLEVEDGAERIMLSGNIVYNSARCYFPHTHHNNSAVRDIQFINNICVKGPMGANLVSISCDSGTMENMDFSHNTMLGGAVYVLGKVENVNIMDNRIQDVPQYSFSAIYVESPAEHVTIGGNIIDTAAYSKGILVEAPHSIVTGNQLYDVAKDGITVYDNSLVANNIIKKAYASGVIRGIQVEGSGSVVSNNMVISAGDFYSGYGICTEWNSDDTIIQHNKVSGNINNIMIRGSNAKVIDNDLRASSTHNISIHGDNAFIKENRMSGGLSGAVQVIGSGSVFRENIGFSTENSGRAIVADGTDSISVAHGLNITPSASNIHVTPLQTLNNASFFWVDSIEEDNFTIHLNTDPEQDVELSWQVGSY